MSALREAAVHLDGALAIAAQMGLPDDDPEVASDRLTRGRTRTRIGDYGGARADLDGVSRLRPSAQTNPLRLDALQELGFMLAGIGDYRDAERLLEEARARAESEGNYRLNGVALARLSIVRTNQLDLARAWSNAKLALERARAAGDEETLAAALDAAELASAMLGEFRTVDRLFEELATIHRRRGDLWFLQYAVFQSTWGPLARCDWERAIQRLEEAESIALKIGDRGPLALYAAVRCWLARSRGAYDRALREGFAQQVPPAQEVGGISSLNVNPLVNGPVCARLLH